MITIMRTGITAFLLGNITLLYWPVFPENQTILMVSGLLVILLLLVLFYKARFNITRISFTHINNISLAPFIFSLCVICMAFLSGWVYSAFYIKQSVLVLDLEQYEGETIRVKGYINSLVYRTDDRQKFVFSIKSKQVAKTSGKSVWDDSFAGNVSLNWYAGRSKPELHPQPGQIWLLDIRLKKPSGMLNPGGFDYEKWLFHNRIKATGYVRHGIGQQRELTLTMLDQLSIWLNVVRQKINNKLDEILSDSTYKGLVKALVIGYRQDIEALQWQLLMHTGTNHLLAISGLHIGLMSGMVWLLTSFVWTRVQWLNIRWPACYVAAITALSSAVVYAGLAGFAIPTLRALLMLTLVFSSLLLKRPFSPSYVLFGALLLVLLVDPLSSLAAGFWLSFCAVAVILFTVSSRLGISRRLSDRIHQTGTVQLIIFIGLIPVSIVLFQQFSVLAPLANFVAVPLMSFLVVPLIFLACISLIVYQPMAVMLFKGIVWLFDFQFAFLGWLSDTLKPMFYVPQAPWYMFVLLIVASAWALLPRGWYGRWLAIFLVLPLLFIKPERPVLGEVQVTFLDVGQGLAIVVKTQNHTLLFDTGDKFSEQFNMADKVIIPYLRLQGITGLDKLIISHSDRDHAGSVNEILKQIEVRSILSGQPELINVKLSSIRSEKSSAQLKQVSLCLAGQQWQWDEVDFMILAPFDNKIRESANNKSCVLIIKSKYGNSILLTGDIEKSKEKQLLVKYPHLRASVLQVPHHGSKTSSSAEFLAQIQPQMAVFSHGYRNRFRHPDERVVGRYKKYAIKIYSTVNGAIDIRRDLSNNSLSVKQYRVQNKRFWHRQAESL